MNEYIKVDIEITFGVDEEEENLGIKPEFELTECKISLDGILAIFPSESVTGRKGVMIAYKNGMDRLVFGKSFKEIDSLHDDYLSNNVLIKAQ